MTTPNPHRPLGSVTSQVGGTRATEGQGPRRMRGQSAKMAEPATMRKMVKGQERGRHVSAEDMKVKGGKGTSEPSCPPGR